MWLLAGVALVLICEGSALAQVLPGGSPRLRAGGGEEDTALASAGNPALLGRRRDVGHQLGLGIGLLPVPVLLTNAWTTSLDRVEHVWMRLGYTSAGRAGDVQWGIFAGSLSVPFAYAGNLPTLGEPYSTAVTVSFIELGGGVGVSLDRTLSIGAALSWTMASFDGQATGAVSLATETLSDVVVFPVPRLRVGLEWFPVPQLGLGLTGADGPYLLGDTATADKDFADIELEAFSGRPPTEVGLHAVLELSARVHAFAEYRLILTNPPAFAEHPLPGNIHQVAGGVEWLIPVVGTGTQVALRGGLVGYNLFEGVWDRTAPVYAQFLFQFNLGLGLYLSGFTIDVSAGLVFWPDLVDFDTTRIAVAFGYVFS